MTTDSESPTCVSGHAGATRDLLDRWTRGPPSVLDIRRTVRDSALPAVWARKREATGPDSGHGVRHAVRNHSRTALTRSRLTE